MRRATPAQVPNEIIDLETLLDLDDCLICTRWTGISAVVFQAYIGGYGPVVYMCLDPAGPFQLQATFLLVCVAMFFM
jgi:hypothetical protein